MDPPSAGPGPGPGRRRRAAARHRPAVQRGAHPGDGRGAPPARPRDPRRHRPGARLARLRRRRPGRAGPTTCPISSRPARRCAASSPGSSPSCGCRSSTCAARCRPPPGSAPPCPTTSGRSAPARTSPCTWSSTSRPTGCPIEAETELLRIAQEAITNARKHASARQPLGTCRVDPPRAYLRIEDDGAGLGTAARRQLRAGDHARARRPRRRALRALDGRHWTARRHGAGRRRVEVDALGHAPETSRRVSA